MDLFQSRPCPTHGDSIANDTNLSWKEEDELKFGTIEELYNSFNKNIQFYVQSVEGFSKVKDVMYHGLRPVWELTAGDKSIQITKDHSVFSPTRSGNIIAKSLAKEEITEVIGVSDNDLFSLKVDKREYVGERPVYDISTASETFVANGILAHNSGGAFWNDQGYILGLVTYGSDDSGKSLSEGGTRNTRCSSFNPSAIHMPQVLGVTIGTVLGGDSTPTPQQQQKRRQQKGGWGYGNYYSYNVGRVIFPTLA